MPIKHIKSVCNVKEKCRQKQCLGNSFYCLAVFIYSHGNKKHVLLRVSKLLVFVEF